jgi:lysophospholipase L1-like esterase
MRRHRILIIGVLTALMLVWMGTPASGDIPQELPAANVGDSFASGEGGFPFLPGTDIDANRCHRSYTSAAQLLGRTPLVDITVDASCSGAVTNNITDNDQWNEPPQAEQLKGKNLKRVYVMIGGNDVGFGDLAACFIGADCDKTTQPDASLELIRTTLGDRLDEAYSAIATAVDKKSQPDVKIIVILYPRILPPTADDLDPNRCPYINEGEVAAGNRIQTALNNTIRNHARKHGFVVVDPALAFRGHDVCSAVPYFYVYPHPATFHPNLAGRAAMAASAVWATL